MHDAIDELSRLAGEHGVETGALALAWLMARPDVTALISGPSRVAPHLALAARARRVELDDEVTERLTELFRTSSARS